jgi:hypothetical protein
MGHSQIVLVAALEVLQTKSFEVGLAGVVGASTSLLFLFNRIDVGRLINPLHHCGSSILVFSGGKGEPGYVDHLERSNA